LPGKAGARSLVQKFIDQRKRDGVSAQTIHNDRVVIHGLYAWLMQRELVAWNENPAHTSKKQKKLDTPVVEHRISTPLTADEARGVVEAARENSAFPSIVLCLSGLRPRGTSRVRWSDVDLFKRTITTFEKSKGRTIPLSLWAVKELAAWKATRPPASEDDLIVSSHSWLYKWMHKITKAHPGVTLQALRRAFLRKLYEDGVSPQLAAKLAGNSVTTIAKHYVSLETLDAHAVVDTLDFGHPQATPPQKPPQKNQTKVASA